MFINTAVIAMLDAKLKKNTNINKNLWACRQNVQ